jgi:3-methyladenine DNA glycosylase AlkD
MVCDLHVSDKDDMVVKALSWALRSLAGHDPKTVDDFLSRNDSYLAARYATSWRPVTRTPRARCDGGL